MVDEAGWRAELACWLEPFLTELNHLARRSMCPLHIASLVGLGERKSMQPMAARQDGLSYDRLQHFISVGVAPQYLSTHGKMGNCQALVSLTLARREVPVMVELQLFLPVSWTDDAARMERAGVPKTARAPRTKPEIALGEVDSVKAAGVRFGFVLADAGYGCSATFRAGLSTRGLSWAVGVPSSIKV